jgi:hypothetical protein
LDPGVGRRIPEQIKGAEFSEMKGIGHFPMSENYPVLGMPPAGTPDDKE